ncbi:hypothetical protein RHGRI_029278 [Rhododendron griersonianum]|uniref:Pentatricopeptide repeat-containing protein n=1 Tax=Rhododendron griersonianum TaxID=479676 RepID=A0AAV6IM63_9ERIC|nr:hypothetical protein RHGRI_029278 [Rhododendron griersonianum]
MFGRPPAAAATTTRLVYCWGAKLIKNSHAHPIGRTQFFRLKSAVSAVASELRRPPPYYLPGLVASDEDEDIICAHKNSGNGVGNALGQSDTCKVVEILNSLREEPCHALSFFDQLKEQGFVHNVSTYMAIIRILCYWGMDMSIGNFDEAIDTLFQTKRRGLIPNIMTCNFLLNRLIESRKNDTAVAVFRQFKRLGLSPNDYSYCIVIKALCRKGSLEEAADIFQEMEEAGLTPNAFTYTTYIEGLCSQARSDLGYEVLKAWREQKIPIDAFTYLMHNGSSIRGYCKIGHILKALALHNEMAAKCIKTNCVIVGVILQCLCQMGMADEAVDQFNNFKELGIFLDEVAYNIVVNALCKLGKLEAAVGLLDEMKGKKMSLDVVHYTTLIGGYCLQGKLVDALKLFEEIKEKGGKVKEAEMFFNGLEEKCLGHCDAMVIGYCEAGNTREAYELFVKLSKQGFSLSRNSCLKLLSNLCIEVENGKALALFEAVLASDDAPCKIMYSKLIAAFCSSGDMRKAQWVLDTMVGTGITPDVITYTMMINGYCRVNCLQEACEVLKDMKARGIEPDVITYTVLIDGHSKEKMKKDSCLPNAEGNKGEQNEVATLWSEMKEIEQNPDVILYTVLIDCHCKSDNLEDATVLFDEMIDSCHCKSDNLEDATVLFDEMIDRGLEPDNVTYTALLCGYCRQGYTDRAVTLLNDMIFRGIQPDSHTMSALHHGILQAKKAKKVQLWHEGPVEDEDGRSLLNCDSKIGLKRKGNCLGFLVILVDNLVGSMFTHSCLNQGIGVVLWGVVLAAWMRLKCPHIAIGALASSATILQFEDIVPPETFYDIVSNSFRVCPSLDFILVFVISLLKLERVNDLYNWLDSAYSYLAMDPANFMMPLPGNPIKEACTEMVMPMSTSQNTTMYPASDFNYTYYKEDCWNSFRVKPRPKWITTVFGGYVSAHHLDLRAATAEDPDWLLEQRASEIKLVEGWLHDYYREKKAVFAS